MCRIEGRFMLGKRGGSPIQPYLDCTLITKSKDDVEIADNEDVDVDASGDIRRQDGKDAFRSTGVTYLIGPSKTCLIPLLLD